MQRFVIVFVIAAFLGGPLLANGDDPGSTSCDATDNGPDSLPQTLESAPGSWLPFEAATGPPISIDGRVGDITNIGEFLERCPTNDPVYQKIRIDFQIRRNDEIVGDIPCSEPISSMPVADYTDELIRNRASKSCQVSQPHNTDGHAERALMAVLKAYRLT